MTDDYKVGYCRPPKASQFKKGQSGNLPGSSRKARERKRRQNRSLGDLVLENSENLLRVRDGNRTSSISTKEALLKKQTAMGLNGNRLALKASLDRIDKAEQAKRAEVLDLYKEALDYKDNYPALAESHRNRGLPPPLPHPDDVHLNRSTGEVIITGPRGPEELAQLKKILEARKIFMKKLDEHRLDAEESARQGCPYSPGDFKIISLIEKHLRSFDYELERRGWLPRVAGEKES
ncbi:DUF5681 domain-containing protein [Nitrobacter sp. JJSN]|uniref:DUF5681 domain-containing protein n=1 Tax=Nitrobacter sp. JJSN TaxID=3453033 RepID=UPI003F76FD28